MSARLQTLWMSSTDFVQKRVRLWSIHKTTKTCSKDQIYRELVYEDDSFVLLEVGAWQVCVDLVILILADGSLTEEKFV